MCVVGCHLCGCGASYLQLDAVIVGYNNDYSYGAFNTHNGSVQIACVFCAVACGVLCASLTVVLACSRYRDNTTGNDLYTVLYNPDGTKSDRFVVDPYVYITTQVRYACALMRSLVVHTHSHCDHLCAAFLVRQIDCEPHRVDGCVPVCRWWLWNYLCAKVY